MGGIIRRVSQWRQVIFTACLRLRRSGAQRPLLKDAGAEELDSRVRNLLAVRSSWYERADLILDTEFLTEEEMTAMIAESIRSKGAYL